MTLNVPLERETPDENSQAEHPAQFRLGSSPGTSRRILHVTLALIVVVPTLFRLVRSPEGGEGEVVGGEVIDEAAPDFTIHLLDRGTFTLTDHLSQDARPVVMNFWASWCVPCREEMPAFDAVARRHPEVFVLGVAVEDTEEAAREFAEEVAVSYPLGLDTDGVVIERYPTLGLPTTWFITSQGTIAARWMGQLEQERLESLISQYLFD